MHNLIWALAELVTNKCDITYVFGMRETLGMSLITASLALVENVPNTLYKDTTTTRAERICHLIALSILMGFVWVPERTMQLV